MSPVLTRARTSTGASVVAILFLVLAFGNQVYVEWSQRHAQSDSAWELLLRTLAWPQWFITSGGNASRDVIAYDLRALLLVVLVAAVVGMAATSTLAGAGAFVLGWFAVIISAAIAALLTAFITTDASLFNALQAAASASTYGLFVGWIVGIATALTRRPAAAVA